MLVDWQAPDHVYLVCGKTDLRKGIDGLAIIIAENYESYITIPCFYSAGRAATVLRHSSGTARVSFYCISVLKMVI